MNFPFEKFQEYIVPKKVFYFSSNTLNVDIEHYFICVCKDYNESIVFTCCTSKHENRIQNAKRNNWSEETLVFIKPNSTNGLEVESLIDCNYPHIISINTIKEKYQDGLLKFKGEIDESAYYQIVNGLNISTLVDEILKESLPPLDSI